MSFRTAIPYLLKRNGWSYRDLDHKTGKSASYWNQTVNGKQSVPQKPKVYEMLASVFGVPPEFFAEYQSFKAAELVLKDPRLAYIVVRQASKNQTSGKKSTGKKLS